VYETVFEGTARFDLEPDLCSKQRITLIARRKTSHGNMATFERVLFIQNRQPPLKKPAIFELL